MITLHSITMKVGRAERTRLLLNDIDWEIPTRSRIVILGQDAEVNTAFLEIISGAQMPTSGWVERLGMVSPVSNLVRYGGGRLTGRQIVHRLARVYRADGKEVEAFVDRLGLLGDALGVQVRLLSRAMRQRLGLALFYGLPCDLYLFENRVSFGPPELADRFRLAFETRQKEATMILATSVARVARNYGGSGYLLHHGRLYAMNSVEAAIAAHEYLGSRQPAKAMPSKADSPAVHLGGPEVETVGV